MGMLENVQLLVIFCCLTFVTIICHWGQWQLWLKSSHYTDKQIENHFIHSEPHSR